MKRLIIIALLLAGCTDAQQAQLGGYGYEFKIELVNCDGSVTKQWISTGKVHSEEKSDGYYFMDKSNGQLVRVTGNLIITQK